MVAIRGRTFKRPWRRSCLSSKLKSSSAPIGREDSWCFHAVGSSNAPLLGSTVVEGSQRIGRTSIATRWRSCGLPQSASCSENFVIPPDVFGQTLRELAALASDIAATETPLEILKECGVEIDLLIVRTVERTHGGLGKPACRARCAGEHDERRRLVSFPGLREDLLPLDFRASEHGRYELTHLIGWSFCFGIARGGL